MSSFEESSLQPHKGSSGSRELSLVLAAVAGASTPQRFVWKEVVARLGRGPEFASTPQRFVWKWVDDLGAVLPEASTPQRFVWKSSSIMSIRLWLMLQPHKGSSGRPPPPNSNSYQFASTPQRFVWKHSMSCDSPSPPSGFNPTKVRLEAVAPRTDSPPARSFNPTKVRLEVGFAWGTAHRNHSLQPHKGSSGSRFSHRLRRCRRASTPQRFVWKPAGDEVVPVPAGASTPQRFVWKPFVGVFVPHPSFASTPQRFVWKCEEASWERLRTRLQPHKGSSGRRRQQRADLCLGRRFNPTKVRLEVGELERDGDGNPKASTPQRFVWKTALPREALDLLPASTPQRFVWKSRSSPMSRNSRALQPHKGSSGRAATRWTPVDDSGFNPTKVRLEGEAAQIFPEPVVASTPQRFVWKSSQSLDPPPAGTLQPHKGSSGSAPSNPRYRYQPRFNPTKVRLEGRRAQTGGG